MTDYKIGQVVDGHLRLPGRAVLTSLSYEWGTLTAEGIKMILATYGPGGTNHCQNCGKMLMDSRPSVERWEQGVHQGFVWIDEDGSEECPKAIIGYHFGPGERITTTEGE